MDQIPYLPPRNPSNTMCEYHMLAYIGIISEEPHANHAVARVADRHFLLCMPLSDMAFQRAFAGINTVEREFLAAEEALPTRILNHIES